MNRRIQDGFKGRLWGSRLGSISDVGQYEQFRQWAPQIDRVIVGSDEPAECVESVSRLFQERLPEFDCRFLRLARRPEDPWTATSATAEILMDCEIHGQVVLFDPALPMSVDTFFTDLHRHQQADAAVSVNEISCQDLRRWPVVCVGRQGMINDIAINETPRAAGHFLAAGGLCWFRDSGALYNAAFSRPSGSIVDVISSMIDSGLRIEPVLSKHVERSSIGRSNHTGGTVFCDLDGTIIRHEDRPAYDTGLDVLPGSKQAIDDWIRSGYSVVLVTARDAKDEASLRRALAIAGVSFHSLVMGLPSGPRLLINDRKPSSSTLPQAAAFEVRRNQGVQHLTFPRPENLTIKCRFPGGSFAETLLIEGDSRSFVRKRVSKDVAGSLGHARLREQCSTLRRFASLNPMTVPELLGEHDCSLEYYYDMQYLGAHRSLNTLNPESQRIALNETISRLFRDVYRPTAQSMRHGVAWLRKHLDQKIYPKLASATETPGLMEFVNSAEVVIDSAPYAGIERSLGRLVEGATARDLVPKTFSLVHGDLTFENVLCADQDIRLIDMDGGGDAEPPELDLGKLLQSLVARYETWAHDSERLVSQNNEGLVTHSDSAVNLRLLQDAIATWASNSKVDSTNALRVGLFYMALHLIRMTPFRLRVSLDQARYSLASATRWLSFISTPCHNGELPPFVRIT